MNFQPNLHLKSIRSKYLIPKSISPLLISHLYPEISVVMGSFFGDFCLIGSTETLLGFSLLLKSNQFLITSTVVLLIDSDESLFLVDGTVSFSPSITHGYLGLEAGFMGHVSDENSNSGFVEKTNHDAKIDFISDIDGSLVSQAFLFAGIKRKAGFDYLVFDGMPHRSFATIEGLIVHMVILINQLAVCYGTGDDLFAALKEGFSGFFGLDTEVSICKTLPGFTQLTMRRCSPRNQMETEVGHLWIRAKILEAYGSLVRMGAVGTRQANMGYFSTCFPMAINVRWNPYDGMNLEVSRVKACHFTVHGEQVRLLLGLMLPSGFHVYVLRTLFQVHSRNFHDLVLNVVFDTIMLCVIEIDLVGLFMRCDEGNHLGVSVRPVWSSNFGLYIQNFFDGLFSRDDVIVVRVPETMCVHFGRICLLWSGSFQDVIFKDHFILFFSRHGSCVKLGAQGLWPDVCCIFRGCMSGTGHPCGDSKYLW